MNARCSSSARWKPMAGRRPATRPSRWCPKRGSARVLTVDVVDDRLCDHRVDEDPKISSPGWGSHRGRRPGGACRLAIRGDPARCGQEPSRHVLCVDASGIQYMLRAGRHPPARRTEARPQQQHLLAHQIRCHDSVRDGCSTWMRVFVYGEESPWPPKKKAFDRPRRTGRRPLPRAPIDGERADPRPGASGRHRARASPRRASGGAAGWSPWRFPRWTT